MTNWTSKDLTGKCGVYIIRNKVNGKFYIGSAVSIWRRWNDHKWELRKGIHNNKHLQRAWNKYGEENFEFDVLEFCDKEIQFQREQEYIDKYWGYESFYNQNNIASKPPINNKTGKDRVNSKVTYMYNEDGLIKQFYSLRECCKWLVDNDYISGIKLDNIHKTIGDKIRHKKSYIGFVFSYKELNIKQINDIYGNGIYMYNDKHEEYYFNSIKECAEYMLNTGLIVSKSSEPIHVLSGTITRAINNKKKYKRKYYFSYKKLTYEEVNNIFGEIKEQKPKVNPKIIKSIRAFKQAS